MIFGRSLTPMANTIMRAATGSRNFGVREFFDCKTIVMVMMHRVKKVPRAGR